MGMIKEMDNNIKSLSRGQKGKWLIAYYVINVVLGMILSFENSLFAITTNKILLMATMLVTLLVMLLFTTRFLTYLQSLVKDGDSNNKVDDHTKNV